MRAVPGRTKQARTAARQGEGVSVNAAGSLQGAKDPLGGSAVRLATSAGAAS